MAEYAYANPPELKLPSAQWTGASIDAYAVSIEKIAIPWQRLEEEAAAFIRALRLI